MGATPPPLRSAPLPGGRRIVVREVGPADRPGLERLYAELDDAARYRRFFSAYHPGERFFDRLLAAGERGAACLVAVVSDDGADDGSDDAPRAGSVGDQVVGEAGYEPLPDGDVELAITVARDWRGWLGPYLLDALREHAAAHGHPNLEADVLATNRPMLAMLRAHRHATRPATEWSIVREVVASDGGVPSWPPRRSGRRVLIEGPGARWPVGAEGADAFDVVSCPGPASCREPCPLLCGRTCPLVDGADVIVMTSTGTEDGWDEIRAAHRTGRSEVPVVVPTRHEARGPALLHAVERRLAEAEAEADAADDERGPG